MKAMIAGIMVSVPLPSEAFSAWEKRASPANSGGNDGRADQDDSNHNSKAQTIAANKQTRKTSTRALSRLDSRSSYNIGTTENGAPKTGSHPVNAVATGMSKPRKGSTSSAAGGSRTGTGGEQEARARRRRSSSHAAAGRSASAPDPPPPFAAAATVAGFPPTDDGTRAARESNRPRKRDEGELFPPGEEEHGEEEGEKDGKTRGGERRADDQAIRGRGSAQVLDSNSSSAARRAPAAVANEAGGRSRAAAAQRAAGRKGAADTGPGAQTGSGAYCTPSRRRFKDEPPPAEDYNGTGQASLDAGVGVGVGIGYAAERASRATWGTGRRVEEDQAAAAAASAIAGVGWRNLRRDTVTALVRQLGRYVRGERGDRDSGVYRGLGNATTPWYTLHECGLKIMFCGWGRTAWCGSSAHDKLVGKGVSAVVNFVESRYGQWLGYGRRPIPPSPPPIPFSVSSLPSNRNRPKAAVCALRPLDGKDKLRARQDVCVPHP